MENKNIVINLSLEQYNKKYRNRRFKLLKYNKKYVEEFDQKYCHYIYNSKSFNLLEPKNYLLKNRKWALIGDTYYEIPKAPRFTWFRNLNNGVQAVSCLLAAGAIATAIAVPTILLNNNPSGPIPEPTVNINVTPALKSKIENFKFDKQQDGSYKGVIKSSTPGDGVAITSVTNNGVKLEESLYTYNTESRELSIDKSVFTSGCEVVIDGTTQNWKDYSNWYNYAVEAQASDIGITKEVKLISPSTQAEQTNAHLVRLIDLDHDELAGNTNAKAHTTWEFANLLSDDDGNSLAYQWNDLAFASNPNYDYLNSTIRFALNGGLNGGNNAGKTGEHKDEILVAHKAQTSWSTTHNKSILSFLPQALKSTIKTVKKSVGVKGDSTYDETVYEDKLFMLSCKEMNFTDSSSYDKGYGTVYKYYDGSAQATRVKKPINNVVYTTVSTSISGCQQCVDPVVNYAGYNDSTSSDRGGYYLLRSPSSNISALSFYVTDNGNVAATTYYPSNTAALAIAPAFCI